VEIAHLGTVKNLFLGYAQRYPKFVTKRNFFNPPIGMKCAERTNGLTRHTACQPFKFTETAPSDMNPSFSKESAANPESDDEEDINLPALPMGSKNYMSPAGYQRLRTELLQLLDVERPQVVEAVSWAAKNGDRSENGDYLYGKKRLREIDRRVRFLTKRLDVAEVVDPCVHHGKTQVFFGATVTYVNEQGLCSTITIKGMDEANSAQGEVSWIAPVARALLKAHIGDDVAVQTPSGLQRIEVLAVSYPKPSSD
jgi:transcription elongation factor GreB